MRMCTPICVCAFVCIRHEPKPPYQNKNMLPSSLARSPVKCFFNFVLVTLMTCMCFRQNDIHPNAISLNKSTADDADKKIMCLTSPGSFRVQCLFEVVRCTPECLTKVVVTPTTCPSTWMYISSVKL